MKKSTFIKKLTNYLLSIICLLVLFINNKAYGQTTTGALPTGSFTTGGINSVPLCAYYDYAWCSYILTAAELNTAGITGAKNLTQIGFYVVTTPGATAVVNNVSIGIRTAATTSYGSGTSTTTGVGYPGIANFTTVLSNASLSFPNGSTWYMITFDTPYAWNGTSNIEILIENRDGSYIDPTIMWGVHTTFYGSTVYRVKYKVQDGSFPAVSGTRSARAAILTKFTYANACTPANPTTVIVNAGGTAGPLYAAANSSFNLTVPTITGGTNCGNWLVAWSNNNGAAGSWWNGSAFSGASASYQAGYSTIATSTGTNATYTGYVQATGGATPGTSNSVVVNAVVAPTLAAKADGTTGETVAAGVTVALTANPSGGSNCQGSWEYAWSNDNGTTYWNGSIFSGGANYSSTYENINVTFGSSTTTYKCYVRCSATTGATANSSVVVTYGACSSPTLTAKANNLATGGSPVIITPSDIVNLTGNHSGGNYCNGNGAWEYAWTDGTGNYWDGSGFNNSSATYNTSWENINPTAPASGIFNYTVYVRCVNNTGCSSSSFVNVNAVAGCTAPTLYASANGTQSSQTIANNTMLTLGAGQQGGSSCDGDFIYAWSNDGGTTYWNGAAFSGGANYNINYSTITVPNVTAGKTFTVYSKCSSDAACASTPSSVAVSIGSCSAPTLTAKANGTAVSLNVSLYDDITLTANSTGGTYCDANSPWVYAWTDGNNYWDGTGFNSVTENYSTGYTTINPTNLLNTKTYTVYVKCLSNAGCSNSSAVTVNVNSCTAPTLTAKANGTASSLTLAAGVTTATLTANPTGGSYCHGGTLEYAWFDGSSYWNGTDFSSATAVYNSAYSSVNITNILASKNYTVYERCAGNTACTSTSSVLIYITGYIFTEGFETGTTGWTLGSNSGTSWERNACSARTGNYGINVYNGTTHCNYGNAPSGYIYYIALDHELDLSNCTTASLSFWYKLNGETGTTTNCPPDGYCDWGQVFIGTTPITGKLAKKTTWTQVTVDLTPYCGSVVFLGFEFDADEATLNQPGFEIDDIAVTAPMPLGTQISSISLLNSGGSQQLTFNNSHINTTTPIFRVKATTSGNFDSYKVEVNTNSTFTGTSYIQTFTGDYASNTEYNLTFTNFTPTAGTVYYVRACASGNGGTTWSAWTTTQHSFVFESGLPGVEWFQNAQTPFKDAGYAATTLQVNSNNIQFPIWSGGSSNVFLNPSFETSGSWNYTAHSGYDPSTFTLSLPSTGWASNGSHSAEVYNYYIASNTYPTDYAILSQSVDMTGVTKITFDSHSYISQQMGYSVSCPSGVIHVYIGGNANDLTGTDVGAIQSMYCCTNAGCGGAQDNFSLQTPGTLSYTGVQNVKFVWKDMTSNYWNGGFQWYIDNISSVSVQPTLGTFTSSPSYLASFNGALGWTSLKWNQTLNDGTITFKIQQYTGGSWQDVTGLTSLSASGNGDKSVDISAAGTDAQLRIVMTMTMPAGGVSPVLNNWALTANACTAPTMTAKANNVATTTAVASGTSVSFTANATGGVNCSDYFEYAWSDGTNYWNGTTFGSATALYSASYNNINYTPTATTATYTVTGRCHASTNCMNTSQVIVAVATPPASISAVISSTNTALGTSHYLTVNWTSVSGITTYGLDYSTDGSSWTTIGDITATTYEFNAGDNPNAPYYFRVSSKNNGIYSGETTMGTPKYTACDYPGLPTISNISGSTLDITIPAESPVANPANTAYSIYCVTTGTYVTATGALGAEVYRSKADWGTITVTGLTTNTNYCFYFKAQNSDGDIRYQPATALSSAWGTNGVEDFDTYTYVADYCGTQISSVPWMFCNLASPNLTWTRTTTEGCSGNALKYATSAGSAGSLMRSALFDGTGQTSVTVSFDMTNSYTAGYTGDNIYLWVGDWSYGGGLYTSNSSTTSQYIYFDHARNCERITLTFNISSLTYKQNLDIGFWSGSTGSAHAYNVVLDNFSVTIPAPTSCATTCTPPTLSVNASPAAICTGSSSTLTASGSGTSYAWSPSTGLSATSGATVTANPTETTTYTVSATLSGCTVASTVTVTVNPKPTVTASTLAANICTGDATTLNASGAATYEWSPSTYLNTTTGASVISTPAANVTYTVTGTDGNGCKNTAKLSINVASRPTPLSGTVTVGSGGTYESFTNAGGLFSAINTYGISGTLNVNVISDISNEAGTIALTNVYTCGGPGSVIIQPDAATVRTIAGGPYVSGTGLIAFNGANNVIIDGSFGGSGKYLKFTNNPSYVVYSIIGFINGANNITVKNTILEGSAIGDNIGTVQILTSNGPDGNNNLIFDNNDIGNSSYINTRVYCSGTAGYPNHDIAFTNNNIFNFTDGGNSMYDYGINVTATGNGSNWTITGNNFYQTGVQTYGAYHMSAISLLPGSASTGNIVSNNWIGGNLPQCQSYGSPGYWGQSNNNSSAQESQIININCGSATISNNVIKNIRFTGSNQNVILLNIAGTTAAIVNGNQFGNSDANLRVSTTSAYMSAINYTGGASGCQFTNNTVRNLRSAGGSYTTNAGINIYPANGDMANLLVSGNIIEIPWQTSATSNYNYGIAFQGSKTISGNVINNRIYDNTSGTGGITYGMYITGPSSPKLYNLTIANNQITLRNSGVSTGAAFWGIFDNSYYAGGSNINYYYNTIYIAGTASASNSAAFYHYGNGSGDPATTNIKNNILINTRTGGSNNWTIVNRYASGDTKWAAGCSDYNLLLNSNASYIGNWNVASGGSTFASWQSSSGGDAHSWNPTYNASTSTYASNNLCPTNLFISPTTGDLHIKMTDLESYKFVSNTGLDLTSLGITTDIDNETRCPAPGCAGGASKPDIGADEFNQNPCTAVTTVTVTPSTASTVCSGISVTFTATPSGIPTEPITYQWANTSGNISGATNSTYTITATTTDTYYCTISNCSGANTTNNSTTLTVNTTPGAPTLTTPQTFCSATNSTVASLSTTGGTNVLWYTSATGGASLSTSVALTTRNYYATQTTTGCESTTRFAVSVTVTTTPSAPSLTTPQTFCSATNPTVANLSTTGGTAVKWYAASNGGSALSTSDALASGTYFASQTTSGCESASRIPITVTVNTTPDAPVGPATQTFCSAEGKTLTDLTATLAGSNIKWYNAASGGSAYAGTETLTTRSYFASQTVSGCESTLRKQVDVTVNSTPAAPIGSATQAYCAYEAKTLVDLTATLTGSNIQWYDALSGGNLYSGTELLATGNYYASQNVTGCESTLRKAVAVTINVNKPVSVSIGISPSNTICSGTEVTFTATPTNGGTSPSYQWKVNGSNGVGSANSPTYVTSSMINSDAVTCILTSNELCATGTPAASLPITMNVTQTPSQPDAISSNMSTFCPNSTGVTFSVSDMGVTSYQWTIPSGSITSGQGTYSITCNLGATAGNITVIPYNGTCAGTAQTKAITFPATATQSASVNGNSTVCAGATAVYNVNPVVGGAHYNWSIPSDATINAGVGTAIITVTFGGSTTGSYSLSVTSDFGCSPSAAQTKDITINTAPDAPGTITAAKTEVCPGEAVEFSVGTVYGATSYNWNVPTGAIIAGQGTGLVTVTFGSASGNVDVTSANSCGSNPSSSAVNITVKQTPATPGAISGPAAVCANSSTKTYSIAQVSNATGYSWSGFPSDASLSGQTTKDVNVIYGSTAGVYKISVTANNGCAGGTSAAATYTVTITDVPANSGTITGPSSLCSGDADKVYSISSPVAGQTYDWALSDPYAFVSDGNSSPTVTVTFGSENVTISVTAINGCGRSSNSSTKAVTVNAYTSIVNDVNPITVMAPATANFSVTASPLGVLSYSWQENPKTGTWTTLTDDANYAGTSTANLQVKNTNTSMTGYTYRCIISGPCGTVTTADGTLTVIPTCTNISSIATQPVSQSKCAGDAVIFTVDPDAAASSPFTYKWRKNGSIISTGTLNNDYTIPSVSAGDAGNYDVIISNCSGASRTSSVAVLSVTNVPAQPVFTISSSSVCQNQSGVVFSVSPVANTSYTWNVPAGASFVDNGGAASSITVTFGSSSGDLSVIGYNSCGSSTARTIAITVNSIPSIPSGIIGAATVCVLETGKVYSIDPVAGATSYLWGVPAGATITSASSPATSVTVTFGANSGNIGDMSVIAQNTCGSSSAQTMAIISNPKPDQPDAITGNSNVCANTAGIVYSVPAVTNATGYTWNYPSDVQSISGQGTRSVTIKFGSLSGNMSVTAFNGCGVSTASILPVNVAPSPPAQPSAIFGPSAVCANDAGKVYSINSIAYATGYTWTVPANATITSNTGTSITVTFGSNGGNITVKAKNACGSSGSLSYNVGITNPLGTLGAITGTPLACAGTVNTYSVTSIGTANYTWSVPSGATINNGQGTTKITVTFGGNSGNVSVVASNSCSVSNTSSLAVGINATIDPPTATAATNINASQFTANWTAVPGAVRYYIDVSKSSDFSSFVSIFNNYNNANFTKANITNLTPGIYYYRVRSAYNCSTSINSNVMTVDVVCTPVTITAQPIGDSKCTGQSTTFIVGTSGSPNIAYQWWKEGVPNTPKSVDTYVKNATSATYTLNPLNIGDAGTYYCVVSNCLNTSLTTDHVSLNTTDGANISLSPANVSAHVGNTVYFKVTTQGAGLSYQWQLNNVNISDGANSAGFAYTGTKTDSLTITNVQAKMNNYNFRCIVSDGCGQSLTSGAATLTMLGAAVPGLWIGVVDQNWHVAGNWDTGVLPNASTAVIINSSARNQPIIYEGNTGVCAALTINPLASVSVQGTLNAASLTVKSNASGTGAFTQTDAAIVNIAGNATIERYMSIFGYHYITSPFKTATVNQITNFSPVLNYAGQYYIPEKPFLSAGFPNLWEIDEHHTHQGINSDFNAWLVPTANEVMTPMKGYTIHLDKSNIVLSITKPGSDLNKGYLYYTAIQEALSSDITHNNKYLDDYGNSLGSNPKTFVGTGPANGWHEVGNPYPSPIDADLISSLSDFTGMIAFYKPTALWDGIYGYYSLYLHKGMGAFHPTRYIPSMQSFMVQNDGIITPPSAAPVITMSNAMRTVSAAALTTNYNKKASDEDVNLPMIVLNAYAKDTKELQDEMLIFFDNKTSYSFNQMFDAQKLFNNDENIPNIYSVINERRLAVKGLPEIKDNLIIPIGFGIKKAGKYTISASELKNIPQGVNVYLEDIKSGKTQNLSSAAEYNFSIEASDEARFFLRFAFDNTAVDNMNAEEICNIYTNENDLYVTYKNPDNENAYLSIINMEGQIVNSDTRISNGTYHTALNLSTGIYLVKVTSANRVFTQKVFIK